jgi:hypothetical protein
MRCEPKRWAVSRTICAPPTTQHPRQPVAIEGRERFRRRHLDGHFVQLVGAAS